MDFDYLRLISLDERESGKLSSISIDTYDMAREYLAELYDEAKSIDHFMTKRGSELIDEIESVQSVLQTVIDQRFKKIIRLAENQIGSGKVDKEELKLLLPVEKEMFDEIILSIGKCRDKIAGPVVQSEKEVPGDHISASEKPAGFELPGKSGKEPVHPENTEVYTVIREDAVSAGGADESEKGIEYETVYVREDIDSFMGIDGHIYSLSGEDIVSLPLQNASVLCGRNIALNIRVSK